MVSVPAQFARSIPTSSCRRSLHMNHLRSLAATSLRRQSPAQRHLLVRAFSSTRLNMAQQFKLKDLTSLDLKDGELKQVEVEGVKDGKVLLSKVQGKVHATTANCTHFGAPLAKGVLTSDGRLVCPWHGACFHVATGDVEDAPALDPIGKFEIVEQDGAVYIKGDEEHIKSSRRTLNVKCKADDSDKVVVVGGGSGAIGVIESLRSTGFKGPVTVISAEGTQPYDRTKLSKALLADLSKVAWRSESFYSDGDISIVHDEATSVDFDAKSVSTKSGKSYNYNKLVLATGGTPKYLPLDGLRKGDLGNVFVLRSLEHTKAITEALGPSGEDGPQKKKRVAVIGSSFIGMEAAVAVSGQGHEVHVIGMESKPCAAILGEQVGAVLQSLLESKGVQFHMKASVEKAVPSEASASTVGAVQLKDGTQIKADIVIEGVGVGPATQFLKENPKVNLQKDGSLLVDDRFVVKDIADGSVYAIGDIATYPYKGANVRIEHWNVAQNAGRAVARDIARPRSAPKPFVPIFWSAQGAQLRYCGHPVDGWDDVIIDGGLEVKDGQPPSFAAYYTKGPNVVAVASMNKDPVMSKSAELFRAGRMPSAQEVRGKTDVLSIAV